MKNPFMRKRIEMGCEWKESCRCDHTKAIKCEDCIWYRMIDSGYGTCIALPTPVVVAWCKDPCSLLKGER